MNEEKRTQGGEVEEEEEEEKSWERSGGEGVKEEVEGKELKKRR